MNELVTNSDRLFAGYLQPMEHCIGFDSFDASDAAHTITFGQHADGFQEILAMSAQVIQDTGSRLTKGLATAQAVITAFFVAVDFDVVGARFAKIRARPISTRLLVGFHRVPFS